MLNKLMEVKNLQVYFYTENETIVAVDGVDFFLMEGEILGIVGESGSGKTVTSLAIMGLLTDTTGKVINGNILFDGRNISNLSEDEMQTIRGNTISMIFQNPMTSLNPVIKVGKQIEETVELHLKLTKAKAKKHAIEMLKSVGISNEEEMFNVYPFQLSGGMRQRVMIAMAMACKPKLLIADEPTTALDVTIQAQILELMKNLRQERNMSVILVTHDLGIIAEMCDRVIVMYCGRILEQAGVFQLFEDAKHPYTIGLIKSIPRLDQNNKRLYTIPGIINDRENIGKGCKFVNRCSKAMDICLKEEPPSITVDMNHQVSCWLCLDR